MGPGTLCCSARTWTNDSSSNKIQRNYKGLKVAACMHTQVGQIMDKIRKDQKPNCHFRRAGSKSRVLHMRPAHTTTKGVGRPPKPRLWTHPYPHPIEGASSPPPRGASKGTCYLLSLPHTAAGAPVKPCLNFLSGILSISID